MTGEIPDNKGETDLLGDPIGMAHDVWGRPSFEVTEEKQELVMVLRASGWSQERIARQIGCDPKTLRHHFSRELQRAADDIEAEALMTFHKRMREGNVAAANRMLHHLETGRAAVPLKPTTPKVAEETPEDTAPAEKSLGKKESAWHWTPASPWAVGAIFCLRTSCTNAV